MEQIIYKDGLYIVGKMDSVMIQLKRLASEYKTVKELVEEKTKRL